MKDLAPDITRQRVIIEATTERIVEPPEINRYLLELSKVLKMRPLSGPFSYPAEKKGFAGWIHWITSGAHFYSYTTKPPLFTVDAYTCKPFSAKEAAEFTKKYFRAKELVWKEIKV